MKAFFKRFARNKGAVVGLIILAIILAAADPRSAALPDLAVADGDASVPAADVAGRILARHRRAGA